MKLIVYLQATGRSPFKDWLSRLRDKVAQARVLVRMRQLEAGNLGDHAAVGEGVIELRIHVGAGYRVYCGQSGAAWIVLLCGGDKATQQKDIARAKEFWTDWKRRQQ